MKNYILARLVKSIISIFVVVSIVIVMVYTLIPTSKVFQGDSAFLKLKGNAKTAYTYNKLEQLGYLDFESINEMCLASSDDFAACTDNGSDENLRVLSEYEANGYVIEMFATEGDTQASAYAYREYNPVELLVNFYSGLFVVDHSGKIQDVNNPDLERGYSIGTTPYGMPAIVCSGCDYKYQVYVDGNFPFIHQNIIRLEFGESFPTQSGVETLAVIGNGQGTFESIDQTFPTGQTASSPIDQTTCKYKPTLDHLDTQKFTDNYASCDLIFESPSMIETSYIFGISSLIIAYIIALPFAIAMARNKGKLIDKFGIAYINFLIAIPSLAFIFIMKYLGLSFGLPDKFPQYGFGDVRSYILPILILALLSTSNIMVWLRRYMIDQSNADYVKFAKAKGLSQKEIFSKHILKNAIIPIVNGIPSSVILAISGSVITETVFAIPGMGKMLPDAIKAANNNMVITLTFIFTALAIFSVFLGDILMTKVDPRIQLAAKGKK